MSRYMHVHLCTWMKLYVYVYVSVSMYVYVYVYIDWHTHTNTNTHTHMHFHTRYNLVHRFQQRFFCGLLVASVWNDLNLHVTHWGNNRRGWRRRWLQQRQWKRDGGQSFKQSTPSTPNMENIRPWTEIILHARHSQTQQIRRTMDSWTRKDEYPPKNEEYQITAMTQDDDVEATDRAVICSVTRTLRVKPWELCTTHSLSFTPLLLNFYKDGVVPEIQMADNPEENSLASCP